MDSDLSDIASEDSDASERVGGLDAELADGNNNDDDEDYIELADETKSLQHRRINSKRESAKRNRMTLLDEDDGEFEEAIPSKKRGKVARTVHDDDDDEEDEATYDEEMIADVGLDSQAEAEQDEEDIEEEEDEGAGTANVSDDAGIGLPSTMPDEEDDVRENTEDSLKRPTKSKMLLELLGDSQSKKSLTEEEILLRRAENARKRKNLSEKRSEEEKQETINKLLKRRAGKSRSHLPKDDETEDGNSDSIVFTKPRRPYVSTGMTRTIRAYKEDLYCTVSGRQ